MSRLARAHWRALAAVVLLTSGATACAGRTGTATAPQPVPDHLVLSVMSTGDLHGHVEALPWLGGYVHALREARSRDGGGVLLVDAGDMFQGTLESNLSEGSSVVRAYNALGYTAAAIGNHEFDFGPEGPNAVPRAPGDNARGAIEARGREAGFPLLAANVRVTGGDAWSHANIKPSALIESAGVTIGLIGVTTANTPSSTDSRNLVGLDFTPLAAAIVREATALRAEGATIVIVLAHAGAACKVFDQPDDLSSCGAKQEIFDVARALPTGLVDAIAAGHTHQAVAHRVNGIPIVSAYAEGVAFGRIDLVVDRQTKRTRETRIYPPTHVCANAARRASATGPDACSPTPYEGRAVTADQRVADLLAPAMRSAAAVRHRPLGVSVTAPFRNEGRTESALGNLVVDLMRLARPTADVALYNWGGLRASIPAGPLTYGRLYELIPFDNAFASLQLTAGDFGRVIVRSLERGYVHSFAGVRVDVRCDGGSPQAMVWRADGERLAPDTRLTVVITDFLASGGDGIFEGVPGDRPIEPGPPMRDILAETLTARGGTLSSDDPAFFDPAQRRLVFPGTLPLRCPDAKAITPAR